MSRRPWYKRYGSEFVLGTMNLTLEEKGAYSLCLDLIYDRGGPIPDDERWLSGVCGVSIRKWKSLRAALISKGKIVASEEGLTNFRAEKEIETSLKDARNLAETGAKGGRKRAENEAVSNKNNDLKNETPKHLDKIREDKNTLEDKSSKADVGDLDGAAWSSSVKVLVDQGRMSEGSARAFFGKLLSTHRLEPRDLLATSAQAQVNGTPDPQGYFTKSAIRLAERRSAPPPKAAAVGFV